MLYVIDGKIDSQVVFQLLQNFLVPVMGTVFFFVFLSTNKSLKIKMVKYCILSAISIFLLIIADATEFYFSLLDHPTSYRMLGACFGYTFRVFILYYLLLLFLGDKSKLFKFFICVPAVFNMIVSFMAFFSENVFYYTEQNELIRGPWIITPFAVSGFYFTLFLILSIEKCKTGFFNEALFVGFVFVCSAIGTLLEAQYRLKGILTGMASLGIIFYYVYFLISNYSYDSLTGAFVRFKLYTDVSRYKTYSLISLDVNGLKKINDTQGHLAGDECLKCVVDTIRKTLHNKSGIYRMGGDEFVILLKTTKIEEIMALSLEIKKNIEEKGYKISLGYSVKEEEMSFDELFSQADNMLYLEKDYYRNANK